MGKCFSSTYGEKLVYSTQKIAADALKTVSREQSKKRAIQKPNPQLVIYLGKNKERDTKAFSKRICDCWSKLTTLPETDEILIQLTQVPKEK